MMKIRRRADIPDIPGEYSKEARALGRGVI
jgi:hypothetical protein